MGEVKSIVYFTNSNHEDSLVSLRILGPARQIGLQFNNGIKNGVVQKEILDKSDLVIFQRDFCRDLSSYNSILSSAHFLKKPVVLDLDDLLLDLPKDHPSRMGYFYTDALLPILKDVIDANLITVSTELLKKKLQPFNTNISVIPNYLNDTYWKIKKPELVSEREKITIGFMGTMSHLPDLKFILPALINLITKYPNRINFKFWGIEPPVEILPFSKIDLFINVKRSYAEFAQYFQNQKADIVIAPLVANEFNSCKSAIKYLEYSACGLPGVYSKLEPYSDVIRDGKNGLLAGNLDEWIYCLSKLIEEPEFCYEIAKNAQTDIMKNWLLSKNSEKQNSIYNQLLDTELSQSQINSPFYDVINKITYQLYEKNENNTFHNWKNRMVKLIRSYEPLYIIFKLLKVWELKFRIILRMVLFWCKKLFLLLRNIPIKISDL